MNCWRESFTDAGSCWQQGTHSNKVKNPLMGCKVGNLLRGVPCAIGVFF